MERAALHGQTTGNTNAGMRSEEHGVGTLNTNRKVRVGCICGLRGCMAPRLAPIPRLVTRPLHVAEDELVLVDGDLARAELREQQQRARGGETWEEVGR